MDASTREYEEAVQAEKEAWIAVGERWPGTDGFDPVAWGRWLACVQAADRARARLKARAGDAGAAGEPGA